MQNRRSNSTNTGNSFWSIPALAAVSIAGLAACGDGATDKQVRPTAAPSSAVQKAPINLGQRMLLTVAHSSQCADVTGGSNTEGTAIIQWPCHGGSNQQWSFAARNGAHEIVSAGTGLCLSVAGASLANAAAVVQSACTGASNQLWTVQTRGTRVQMVASHSSQCLNVFGGFVQAGTKLIQWPCGGGQNELWSMLDPATRVPFDAVLPGPAPTPAPTPTPTPTPTPAPAPSATPLPIGQRVRLVASHSDLCADVFGGSVAQGARTIQWACHGGRNQQWAFYTRDGGFEIQSVNSNLCLSVEGASAVAGARMIQSACVGGANQRWSLRTQNDHVQIVAAHSGQCLNVFGAEVKNGSNLIQWPCGSAGNEKWSLIDADTGVFYGVPDASAVDFSKSGRWSPIIPLSLVPVAAANLPNGKVLAWSAYDRFSFGGSSGKTFTTLFDPATNSATEALVSNTGHDMFCPGISNLADGRVLVNGGSNTFETSIYDWVNERWDTGPRMNIPRGYQANTTLGDGSVLTLGGSWSGGRGNKDGELWTAGGGWRRLTNVPAAPIAGQDPGGVYRGDNHAWLFTAPDGRVFHAGPSKNMHWITVAGNGSISLAGSRGDDAYSMNGTAVLYDIGKILKTGGASAYENAWANRGAYTVDINAGVSVKKLAPLNFARAFHTSVVLPNGQVMVVGGQSYPVPFSDDYSILTPELWDPQTEQFTTLSSMREARTYHSVAILLADGRVLAGGGGLCGGCTTNHPNVEIFTPPYLLDPQGGAKARPVIVSAPGQVGYGASVSVRTDSPISSMSLMRMSNATHTVNNDQRRVPLSFTAAGSNTYNVSIPSRRGVAPPGYYMLFVMNAQGVPSVSSAVRLN